MIVSDHSAPAESISPLIPVGTFPGDFVTDGLYGIIGALLLRGSAMGAELADELTYLGYSLPRRPFRVVLFALDQVSASGLSGHAKYQRRLSIYRDLMEYLRDQLPKNCCGFLMLQMGYLIGLLYPQEPDTLPEICRETIDYGIGRGYPIHVNISMPYTTPENVASAFHVVENLEQSRSFFTGLTTPVLEVTAQRMGRIRDTQQRTSFEQTFFKSADQICGSIRSGNLQATENYLTDQLRKIAENCLGLPYPITLNLTVNRFMNLLQYRLVAQDLATWRYLSQADFSRDLAAASTMEEYLIAGKQVAAALLEHSQQRTSMQYDSLMHDIYAYIEENATDVNMGLTAIARQFRLRPREAAENFRQYFGESVNDVMHRARVRKAKDLLLTTNDSVQEIADAVGYCSLATMYRAFTNIEGVAPGKLRQKKNS